MAEPPLAALEVAVELARIAATPGRIEQRAEALLAPLRRVVPYQAARICLFDPERYEQLTLISSGLPAGVDRPTMDEVELLGLHRPGPPLCVRDLPVPPAELRIWSEWLWPAGFREGVAVALFAPGGRQVGLLGLLTDTPAHPTDAARDLIGTLAPLIAAAVDRLPSVAAAARIVRDAQAGIVLTSAGNPLPLPGLPDHPLLSAGSAVLAVAAHQLATGGGHGRFLAPHTGPDTTGGHLRVTVLDCAGRPPDHLCAVVLVSPAGDLRGLGSLELRILGMLIDDWPDQRIAAALVSPDSQVAGHIEDILAKLAAPTRDLAALRAIRLGLHLPPALSQIRQ